MAYGTIHRHVFASELPPLLERHRALIEQAEVVADIGCGDGPLLVALRERGLLPPTVLAVDHDQLRVERAARISPNIQGLVASATALPIADETADLAICTQVIEHVPDQARAIAELFRILKPGGSLYVDSIARGQFHWWFYRRDGEWWLDPTHVREYSSQSAFLALLSDFEVTATDLSPLRFPVVDLVVRAAVMARVVSPDRIEALGQHQGLRRIKVRPPGYRFVAALARKS